MSIDQAIREQLQSEMRRQGVTQAELARRLGVQPPTVAQVLSGRRARIPSSLVTLLDQLGLTLRVVPKVQGEKENG